MSANPDIPLFLFAKAPVPGQVKTRMQPELTEAGAAELANMMLAQSVRKINTHWPGSLVLTVSPDLEHGCFRDLRSRYRMDIEVQVEGDLGQRIIHVLEKAIRESGGGVVMGCDVPQISGNILSRVHARISKRKNIIGPAVDGGFYILGLHELNCGIFNRVDWGSSQVLTQTLDNLKSLGMDIEFCQELRDIDNWSDLCWLAGEDPCYQRFINNTGAENCAYHHRHA